MLHFRTIDSGSPLNVYATTQSMTLPDAVTSNSQQHQMAKKPKVPYRQKARVGHTNLPHHTQEASISVNQLACYIEVVPVTTGPIDQSVKEGATPAYFSHPDFTNGEFNIKESVGGLFAPPLGEDTSPNGIDSHIRARRGNERQWYQGGRESYFSNPATQQGNFHLELINQAQRSLSVHTIQSFKHGQVVWHRDPVGASYGYIFHYDPQPYIILDQCKTTDYFVLMDHTGHVYPRLVSPHFVEPVLTTWITVRLPMEWYYSDDVRSVLQHSCEQSH